MTDDKVDPWYATVLNSAISVLEIDVVSEIIFEFLQKWPHNKHIEELRQAASRLVYMKHYKAFHSKDPPERVVERSERYIGMLILKDEKPNFDTPEKKKKKRVKNSDELSVKLRDMSTDDIFAWEKKLGVDKKIIKRQKELIEDKKGGLARMSMANAIRKKVKPKSQNQ